MTGIGEVELRRELMLVKGEDKFVDWAASIAVEDVGHHLCKL